MKIETHFKQICSVFFLFVFFTGTLFSQELNDQEEQVKLTFATFTKELMSGNEDAAFKLVYVSQFADAATIKSRITGAATRAKKTTKMPKVAALKIENNLAALIMEDAVPRKNGSIDYDTVYFVSIDDEWKLIFGRASDVLRSEKSYTEDLLILKKWNRDTKKDLKKNAD